MTYEIHSVSIPLWCDCDSLALPRSPGIKLSFNPTMVRLRHILAIDNLDGFVPVSIPLWCDCDNWPADFPRLALWFQSHYGAIATLLTILRHMICLRFNPTMVRLRRLHVPLNAP